MTGDSGASRTQTSAASRPLRILFALPGFHREDRGAEVALLSVAEELARGGDRVTVAGSGENRPGTSYDFRHVPAIGRRHFERFPRIPPLRSDTVWEDATFAAALLTRYRPADYDAVITCNFPFSHWALRRWSSRRPLQVYVTQNGDWPAHSRAAEFRTFHCDGLVCTNPDYEETNRDRWRTALIPNGFDPARYAGAVGDRAGFGLPAERPVVLMVSACIPTKRVAEGIEAVSRLPEAHLAVAGDGPLRAEVDALAARLLPGRFTPRLTVPAARMPSLYRSADAFLHMSLHELFGNVFVEAMASGLPIVGHDTARLRWIVGDRDTLCDTQDPAAVTGALGTALATGQGAADPRVELFAWPVIAARYRAFLLELMAGRT